MSKKNRISTKTSKHHRLPRSKGGKTNEFNCVMLNPEVHKLWHQIFSNLTPTEIQVEICRVFYGFDESQLRDVRTENFLDLVMSITESKDRC
jgi:hypothetical protein